MSYDIVIVGGGPAGYVAAIRAAQLGKKVAVVEAKSLGGVCLNWGCIPTKALLKSAEVVEYIKHSASYGIQVGGVKVDFTNVINRSREVADKLSNGISFLMKKNNIEVLHYRAKLASSKTLRLFSDEKFEKEIHADHIIFATGSRSRPLPNFVITGKRVWDYNTALQPPLFPKKLLIVGAGAIGVEFASFYRTMGSEVVLVEFQKNILPLEDSEISEVVKAEFTSRGIKVVNSSSVVSCIEKSDGVVVKLQSVDNPSDAQDAKFDAVIVAAGVVPNVENLGLEGTKVVVEKQGIVTDAFGATAEEGIYAIGDVAGPPYLAHKASHEAVICVEKICGLKPHGLDKDAVPGCTYCQPQVASVGLTEDKCKEKGLKVKVGRFYFRANGKAIAVGQESGVVKVIFDAQTGELLGAHMVGEGVTEMIQGFLIAKKLEATAEDLMNVIFPHPTMSEAIHESILSAYDKLLHA